MNSNCNNLDAYLADDLSVDDAAAICRASAVCDDCREAVDEQLWIDGLLRSEREAMTRSCHRMMYW